MAKDFSTATKLPDDFVQFDFSSLSPATYLDTIDNVPDEEKPAWQCMAKAMMNTRFTMDSNLENVKDSIEKAALDRLAESMSEEELRDITVTAGNDYVTYIMAGHEFGVQYGNIQVNEKYMENGEYPIIPCKGSPEGVSSWFIGEHGGHATTDEEFIDFHDVEEGLKANREFAASVGGLEGPDEGIQK